jgi:hypothetical protein
MRVTLPGPLVGWLGAEVARRRKNRPDGPWVRSDVIRELLERPIGGRE